MEVLVTGAEKLSLRLTPRQLEQFKVYYQELIDWNQRLNLTAITDYEEVQVKHFLDSLTVVQAFKLPLSKGMKLIDVGTGAGIPGIPLKILLPEIELVLLDATKKKAGFLEHIIQQLNLKDVEIVVGRAEEVAHKSEYRQQFDLVLSRAVAGLSALVELTLPFCAIGGRFIAQKKGSIETEVQSAQQAISLLGGELTDVKSIDLPEFGDRRWLVVIDKVGETPAQYPRRPGIPAKRPLV
ncbi:MAG: 16S rRNA (guanine(527)-N(7))-methyltransferase RsmG [Dehalococcoidia bacterium]|nr:16S rRNA (guanine(527)-N(7))-methyltransferase RsmG [Dehalococcoidia bacterium]